MPLWVWRDWHAVYAVALYVLAYGVAVTLACGACRAGLYSLAVAAAAFREGGVQHIPLVQLLMVCLELWRCLCPCESRLVVFRDEVAEEQCVHSSSLEAWRDGYEYHLDGVLHLQA